MEQRPLMLNRKKPWMTYGIIIVTCAVYLLEELLGAPENNYMLVLMGAKYNPLIEAGQYWRLITPIVLHANLTHVGMNMVSLYLWGPNIEALYGRWKMLALYLFSGILGVAASYLLSDALSVGASGAIFGLFGTLLSFKKDAPEFFKKVFGSRVIILIVLNIVNGVINIGIDNWAHLGGLLGGFLAAEFLGTFRRPHEGVRPILFGALYALLLLAALFLKPLLARV